MQIPTLIDNVEGNTLLKVLESLLVKSVNLDIATGTFENWRVPITRKDMATLGWYPSPDGRRDHTAYERSSHQSPARSHRCQY